MMMNIFDVTKDNVHMVQVDQFEADAPPPTATKPTSTATDKQLGFLKSLFAERTGSEEAMIIREHLLSEYRAGTLSIRMASDAIEEVKAIPRNIQNPQGTLAVSANHGEVWVSTDGQFVRVKESLRTGHLYGMIWSGYQWEYTPGIMNKLDHKITAEEAAQWGHEHQWCVFCSLPLSDPRSEIAGYGPTCARKNDLPWGDLPSDLNSPPSNEEPEDPAPNGYCRLCGQSRPFGDDPRKWGCNC